jgi:hypothetical protein
MPRTAAENRKILLKRARAQETEQRARPVVKLYDKDWLLYSVLWGEIEAEFEERLNDTGEGSLKIFGKHKARDWLLKEVLEAEDVHITVETPGYRWAGKADTITYTQPSGSTFDYVECHFLHDYEHVKKVICYSNPVLPAEFQWPKIWMWAGPSIFGVRTLIFLNLLRRFGPLWALPENIFSPASWLANLNPDNWPIVVKPGSGLLVDTSMWTVLSTRFGNLHDVITPTMRDAGLQLTCERWLPGDPQPAPGHMFLTKATLLLGLEDKSGVRGPTGTALDGLLSLGSTILADGITEVIDVVDAGPVPPEYDTIGFFGTVKEMPWVSFRNGMRTGLTGISSWSMTVHKTLAGAIVTGGKSPSWVNSGLKLLLNAALGYIGMLFGNPGLALGIFDKQVEDVILAFHRVGHPIRQSITGRGQYGEHWENTGGTGFSVSALQAIRIGLWKTRAYTSFKFEVVNGKPYWIHKHFTLGDRASGETGDVSDGIGKLYVDQVHGTKLTWGRDKDATHEIVLGNGDAERLPGALLSSQLEQVRALIQALGVDS